MSKKSSIAISSFVCFLLFSTTSIAQHTHENQDYTHHEHENSSVTHNHQVEQTTTNQRSKQVKLVTGQGAFVFLWDKELTEAFPEEAHEFEPGMHGGFNEDPETGIVYTGIPGYGLCSISPDLKQWKTLGSDERLKDNIHGIVFFIHKGKKHLAVTQEGKRVLVLTLDGKIVSEILKPTGSEFKFAAANAFFSSADSNFGVTDVTYLKGTLYVTHGYSKGDFVMTIKEKGGAWNWGELAWGGKGDNPGQFQTAHGIYAHNKHILVANRAAGQVVKFTKKGKFVETFNDIPANSLVCNVSYKTEHYFLNALSAIGDQKSAPIYVHTGEKLVSTIIPGDLDIPTLTNIHQVWPHFIETKNGLKQLYLLVHGWNKGKFAVLKLDK
ncbi:NHL repeat-containing protein [Maribacter antarcticus]|uniref:hypothetical protein n=1 Tax=Maribacter antarcticus TaxID=505250 RepID=UPI00047A966E|nr:hypothetical protein [Maribacter antarcticus]